MAFAHLAQLPRPLSVRADDRSFDPARQRRGVVSRDPLPAMSQAVSGLLLLHREIMAERDQTLRLTQDLASNRQALAELQSYVALLERELARLQRRPDVDGWR